MATSEYQHAYLASIGVECWQARSATAPVCVEKGATDAWSILQQRVSACTACPLHQSRTQTVFGVGDQHADLLIVGEAPGAQEDKQGQPFVGRAGQLLDAMLNAIGLQRERVYIANVLKCRPPNNRDPKPEEMAQCTPFLEQQVQLLQPKLILAVGRYAAHYLLNTSESLSRLRKRVHQFRDTSIPLIVSYHPAYLLRSPQEKRKSWEDFITVSKMLRQSSAEALENEVSIPSSL